jgi:hypothetical protein
VNLVNGSLLSQPNKEKNGCPLLPQLGVLEHVPEHEGPDLPQRELYQPPRLCQGRGLLAHTWKGEFFHKQIHPFYDRLSFYLRAENPFQTTFCSCGGGLYELLSCSPLLSY